MKASLKYPILCALCAPLALGASSLLAQDSGSLHDGHGPQHPPTWRSSPLVKKVRAATRRYRDVNVAIEEGWVQATPCVSGPNSGAMGVHYVLPDRVEDVVLSADQPEALIYEPLPGGWLRLVGVEFIMLAEAWDAENPDAQPAVDGHLLHLVGAPNRYRLPAFYELHVWAWEHNPDGSFVDWNTQVSCDRQPAG